MDRLRPFFPFIMSGYQFLSSVHHVAPTSTYAHLSHLDPDINVGHELFYAHPLIICVLQAASVEQRRLKFASLGLESHVVPMV